MTHQIKIEDVAVGTVVCEMHLHQAGFGLLKGWTVISPMKIDEPMAHAMMDVMDVGSLVPAKPISNKMARVVSLEEDYSGDFLKAVVVLYLYDFDYYIATLTYPVKPAPATKEEPKTFVTSLETTIDLEAIAGNHDQVLRVLGYISAVGMKIRAILLYRAIYGVGLIEAKNRIARAEFEAHRQYTVPTLAARQDPNDQPLIAWVAQEVRLAMQQAAKDGVTRAAIADIRAERILHKFARMSVPQLTVVDEIDINIAKKRLLGN